MARNLKYLWFFFVLVLLSFSSSHQTRAPAPLLKESKDVVVGSMMETASKVLKASIQRQAGKPSEPKRLSPGGPDPRHH